MREKCITNDKGICHLGRSCYFTHSRFLCRSYSKIGRCEDDISCQLRHPTGICIDWRRGVCEQDDQCLYRHPNEDHGTLQSRSSYQNEDEGKRKRTSSPIPAPPMKNMKEHSKDGKTFNNFHTKR